MRKTLSGKHMLNNFLKEHAYRLSQISFRGSNLTIHPLRNIKDVSILGFDDIPLCRYTIPPLTTIRQNRAELGKSAFFAMTSQLNHVPISTLLLHAELVLRSSCQAVES